MITEKGTSLVKIGFWEKQVLFDARVFSMPLRARWQINERLGLESPTDRKLAAYCFREYQLRQNSLSMGRNLSTIRMSSFKNLVDEKERIENQIIELAHITDLFVQNNYSSQSNRPNLIRQAISNLVTSGTQRDEQERVAFRLERSMLSTWGTEWKTRLAEA